LAVASIVTWSHWFLIAPSAQTSVTRSEPLAPAPGRRVMLSGFGAADHVEPFGPLDTRNTKSAGTGRLRKLETSIITPLIPRP
jgi:hypothetical protein